MIAIKSFDAIGYYDREAERLSADYETLDVAAYRATFATMLPAGSGRIALDVGAGSGRDAAWLAGLGFETVAAEPAAGMRAAGRRRHGDAPIRWLDDRLPALAGIHALGLSFDLILVSAVWQHVPPAERPRAFRRLVTLLKPSGLLVLTLRHGPAPPDRPMHEVSAQEVETLARDAGLAVVRTDRAADTRRPGVDWTAMCLRLPDDGTGALPLLRGIILNDDKAATYKLGLLRAVARLADLSPNLARQLELEDEVEIPLGAVALNWLRMYLPLVRAGLPQAPRNAGPDGLGFARENFRALMASALSAQDLRFGAEFSGERALAVAGALGEAARTIVNMPANFTRYPNSSLQVFRARKGRARRTPHLSIDADTLRAYGTLRVPGHVWRAMQRLGAWIEPLLVAEWARLTRNYASRSGGELGPGLVESALAWIEPQRDVRVAREAALARIAAGERLRCVWSGRALTAVTLDIDHCFPWSAWPCGDLWNLLPAHRTINRHRKRDRLPSAGSLEAGRLDISRWWDTQWRAGRHEERFQREVDATLAVARGSPTEDVFSGVEWRRLRLRQDQQLVEWDSLRASPGRLEAGPDGGVAALPEQRFFSL